ncbi:hypothetical protein B9Z55_007279 [Caenorhabditis nigoni]|nr:hypothetical protein B9Z55_007279 [Caenorhabditis nigoni]
MNGYNNPRPKKRSPPEEPIIVDPELLAQHLECKKAQDKIFALRAQLWDEEAACGSIKNKTEETNIKIRGKIREFREKLKDTKQQRKEEVDEAVREAAKISYEVSLLRDTPREEFERCIEVVLKIEVENAKYRGMIEMIKEDIEEMKAAAAAPVPMETSDSTLNGLSLNSAELNRKLYIEDPIQIPRKLVRAHLLAVKHQKKILRLRTVLGHHKLRHDNAFFRMKSIDEEMEKKRREHPEEMVKIRKAQHDKVERAIQYAAELESRANIMEMVKEKQDVQLNEINEQLRETEEENLELQRNLLALRRELVDAKRQKKQNQS